MFGFSLAWPVHDVTALSNGVRIGEVGWNSYYDIYFIQALLLSLVVSRCVTARPTYTSHLRSYSRVFAHPQQTSRLSSDAPKPLSQPQRSCSYDDITQALCPHPTEEPYKIASRIPISTLTRTCHSSLFDPKHQIASDDHSN